LPFYTQPNSKIISAVQSSIKKITGLTPELSTSGGTSDGRFFALYGTQVVELGPINETIHKINEHVNINDLTQQQKIYDHIFSEILLPG
jgi:succinyl-diaminopimelate desuccinylase